jgi:hypothetical protein
MLGAVRAALLVIMISACGGGKPATPPPAPLSNVSTAPPADAAVDAHRSSAAEAIAMMGKFSDAMCRCVDKACADRVVEDMSRWGTEMAKAASPHNERITEEDTRQMAVITEEMTKCMTKAMMQGMGSGATP